MQKEKLGGGEPAIGREQVNAVLQMDDNALREAVRALATAGGMSERRASAVSRDADAIRRRLSSVTAEDLQKMLSRLTPEMLSEISGMLDADKKKR